MSLDEKHMRITDPGTVTISTNGIVVDYFDADGASCRDVAVMACAWAIGELQREMLNCIEKPESGKISIGYPKDYEPKAPPSLTFLDAPVHYTSEQASAWIAGVRAAEEIERNRG